MKHAILRYKHYDIMEMGYVWRYRHTWAKDYAHAWHVKRVRWLPGGRWISKTAENEEVRFVDGA